MLDVTSRQAPQSSGELRRHYVRGPPAKRGEEGPDPHGHQVRVRLRLYQGDGRRGAPLL